jgi:chemotaxis-related protein WspB
LNLESSHAGINPSQRQSPSPAIITMLLLTFRIAQDLYAVDVARVVGVIPRIEPRPIPRTPAFLAGLFGYRGRVVPAVDLGLLLGKAPSPGRLSTRVILVETGDASDRASPARRTPLLLGLIAEQVDDVVRVDRDQVVFPSMRLDDARFLGAMVRVDSQAQSLAQMIEVDWVLPPALREALFGGWEKTDEQAERDAEEQAEAEDESPAGAGRGVAVR